MHGIMNAIYLLVVIGAISALAIIIAAKFMSVKENELFPALRSCLPGANCDACGYAGCEGYAKPLADGETTETNKCTPGADKVSKALSDLLGTKYEDAVEMVATVNCLGDCMVTAKKADYHGIKTCAGAKLIYGGSDGQCMFGCIGFGDCAGACPNNAIRLVNGIASVNTKLCSGCGICVKTCPQKIISLFPDIEHVIISCSNTDKGALTRKACAHGCIACRKCERECPNGAVTVENNLARIDYEKCLNCNHCVLVCPTGAICISDFSGVHKLESSVS